MTTYFTQLKVYWDQLYNFRPTPICSYEKCTCNLTQKLEDLHLQELVMQFFMGLNDPYSQIKGQILFMDPLPFINKVYSLLIQEERQRSVGHGNFVHIESTTLAVKSSNPNFSSNFPRFFCNSSVFGGKNSKGKDRPICTHYGKLGHVMEKCFKLHRFPLGFKLKGKNFMVNQVNAQEGCADKDSTSAHFPFTQEQCQ